MSREQRTVFGEIAEQYDTFRPSYPEAMFDAVVEFGGLAPAASALEIGAGTGKATAGFVARGLRVLALEPSPEMAAVLRAKGVPIAVTTFEAFTPDRPFDLVYAAQAWHWVHGDDRCERVARALARGGVFAAFWNKPRPWEGPLRAENDAAYERFAPKLTGSVGRWELDRTIDELAAAGAFAPADKQVFTWIETYSTGRYIRLLGTHSDHRMLADADRQALHAAVAEVIDRHGATVDVVYDTHLYLARRL